jgi:hypothetical protein
MSESHEAFTDYQPQYPDLRGYFNADIARVQDVFDTIRQLSDLTRHIPASYSVIEEIVEVFVEGFFIQAGYVPRQFLIDNLRPRRQRVRAHERRIHCCKIR